jgi:nitronate monooxygenase
MTITPEVPLTTRLKPLVIKGRSILPIVQGGMGVGISAHRLAGNVARWGAMGTIAGVDLRRHHPDLMAETAHCRDRAAIDRANLLALEREIAAAKAIAGGRGLLDFLLGNAIPESA